MSDGADDVDHVVLSALRRRLAAATARPCRVVFAEGDDARVRAAADLLVPYGIAPLLISRRDGSGPADGTSPSVRTVTLADLAHGVEGRRVEEVGAQRGWATATTEQRRWDPLYLAAAVVDTGGADACVAGSTSASGDVIRAAIHVIGLAPGAALLSSSFLLLMPDGRVLSFGDCAVVPRPGEHQLAEIAVATARTFEELTGTLARVAMLSFSTKGSADNAEVRRVREATRLVAERAPDLAVDGELQFDAALVPSVAQQKAPGSAVAGTANVFIFPDLSAGNIGYKIAQRLGGAQALGPILQGLSAPMNDLSRGCSTSDVANVALISALQAQALLPLP